MWGWAIPYPALERLALDLRGVFSQIPGLGGAQAGSTQTSRIETAYLRMELNHQSGQLSGTVNPSASISRMLADRPSWVWFPQRPYSVE